MVPINLHLPPFFGRWPHPSFTRVFILVEGQYNTSCNLWVGSNYAIHHQKWTRRLRNLRITQLKRKTPFAKLHLYPFCWVPCLFSGVYHPDLWVKITHCWPSPSPQWGHGLNVPFLNVDVRVPVWRTWTIELLVTGGVGLWGWTAWNGSRTWMFEEV